MEDIGLFGLDERTVSLICGFSVLCVVLVIVSLGIIGFFVKVGFLLITFRNLFLTLRQNSEESITA